jgi:hypothetical protein
MSNTSHTPARTADAFKGNHVPGNIARDGAPKRHLDVPVAHGHRSRTSPLPGMLHQTTEIVPRTSFERIVQSPVTDTHTSTTSGKPLFSTPPAPIHPGMTRKQTNKFAATRAAGGGHEDVLKDALHHSADAHHPGHAALNAAENDPRYARTLASNKHSRMKG